MITIGCERHHTLHISARRSLVPRSARARPIMHLAGRDCPFKRLTVHMRDHQYRARHGVLRNDCDQAAALVEVQLVDCHRASTSISRTGSARSAFVAMMSPPNAVALPLQSVNDPPASVTMG